MISNKTNIKFSTFRILMIGILCPFLLAPIDGLDTKQVSVFNDAVRFGPEVEIVPSEFIEIAEHTNIMDLIEALPAEKKTEILQKYTSRYIDNLETFEGLPSQVKERLERRIKAVTGGNESPSLKEVESLFKAFPERFAQYYSRNWPSFDAEEKRIGLLSAAWNELPPEESAKHIEIDKASYEFVLASFVELAPEIRASNDAPEAIKELFEKFKLEKDGAVYEFNYRNDRVVTDVKAVVSDLRLFEKIFPEAERFSDLGSYHIHFSREKPIPKNLAHLINLFILVKDLKFRITEAEIRSSMNPAGIVSYKDILTMKGNIKIFDEEPGRIEIRHHVTLPGEEMALFISLLNSPDEIAKQKVTESIARSLDTLTFKKIAATSPYVLVDFVRFFVPQLAGDSQAAVLSVIAKLLKGRSDENVFDRLKKADQELKGADRAFVRFIRNEIDPDGNLEALLDCGG